MYIYIHSFLIQNCYFCVPYKQYMCVVYVQCSWLPSPKICVRYTDNKKKLGRKSSKKKEEEEERIDNCQSLGLPIALSSIE